MNWNIRKKILAGFGFTLMISTVILIWAVINLRLLGDAANAILSENYRSILAAEHMIDSIERQDSAVLLYLLNQFDEATNQFVSSTSDFLVWFGRAKDNITIPGEGDIISSIETGYQDYLKTFSHLQEANGGYADEAYRHYAEEISPVFKNIRSSLTQLRELNQNTMYSASLQASRISKRAIFSMTVAGAFAIITGIVFSLLISSKLVRPLLNLTGATERIASGDYSVQVKIESNDELGELAKRFNTMVAKVNSFHNLNIGEVLLEKRKIDALIRSIRDGIIFINQEFHIINANPAAEKILDFSFSKEEPHHFLEVFDNQDLFGMIREGMESGSLKGVIDESEQIITFEKNGAYSYYQFSLTPVVLKDQKLVGMVLLLRDITALTELDRMKSDFIMTASHELKTPLTSMGMSIELLCEELGVSIEEKNRELLKAAGDEVGRMKALVADLLDLSRIESGKMNLEITEFPVDGIIRDACALMRKQVEEAGISLICKVQDSSTSVRGDGSKIAWVITNMVANAIRYTDKGGEISVFYECLGDFVHFSVRDTGEGIPYEYQSKVFDKFVQVKSEKSEGGTGLGLSICKELVKAHGGTIWVDSVPGSGCTFTFTIPLVK